ncbi:MAG: DegT/DnrJ/EryC1/StrS family aminotransferase [Caldilineaceae bacterium]|nr:DegT/DnrJ/EryC1/StrS family aminotransferase [Caldilineaceae bacterium]
MTAAPATTKSLAVYGGSPLRQTPFPPRSLIGPEEKEAVLTFLEQTVATGAALGYNGDEENAYCQEFSAWMGSGYTDAVNSGTASLYVALQSLQLEPFTEVIVPAVTDPGGMMPVPLLNLIPVVADTEPNSYNIGPEQIAPLISPLTSAIIVAHIAGEPANIAAIMALARQHNLPVIEDCSQSHGARLHGQLVGTFGDIGAFSTMGGKHHCSGGQGGVVYTKDEARHQIIRRCSDRGKPFFLPPGSTNTQAALNLNMTDLGGAIGRVQLRKLHDNNLRRQTIVGKLGEGIEELATISLPALLPGAESCYWFLRLRFHADQATCDKETYCEALSAEGLPIAASYRNALPHTMDWYVKRRVFGTSGYPWTSPDYRGDPNREFPCPNAHATMDTHFNLYFHENWDTEAVADAIAIFQKVDAAFHA